MRLISACLACLLGTVAARKEILKRQGDYYLRLHNQGGNLVLDEGIKDTQEDSRSLTILYF